MNKEEEKKIDVYLNKYKCGTKRLSCQIINEKLAKHYEGTLVVNCKRELKVLNMLETNERTCIFSLSGSPPKGYAIFNLDGCRLHMYDAWGRRFKNEYLFYIGNLNLRCDKKRIK